VTCEDMAYHTTMLDKEEGDEWQEEEETKEVITMEYIQETI
jgi:hypothetical protein